MNAVSKIKTIGENPNSGNYILNGKELWFIDLYDIAIQIDKKTVVSITDPEMMSKANIEDIITLLEKVKDRLDR